MYHSAEDLPSRDPFSHNAHSSPPPNYWGCLETYNHISKENSPWFSENQALTPTILSCRAVVPVHTRRSHTHLLVLTPKWIPSLDLFSQKPAAFKETAKPLVVRHPRQEALRLWIFIPLNLLLTPKRKGDPALLAHMSSPPCALTLPLPQATPPGGVRGCPNASYSSCKQWRASPCTTAQGGLGPPVMDMGSSAAVALPVNSGQVLLPDE